MGHRDLVDGDEAASHERAVVEARVGWPNDTAVQHAGDAHVVDVGEGAGDLVGDVDARHSSADEPIIGRRLHGRGLVEPEMDPATA